MGSLEDVQYSVQGETRSILENGIINNPLIPKLPHEIHDAARLVHFEGKSLPSIPINWRFAESAAALKAFEASMLNVLRARKYGAQMSEITIDTDHASLFVMSPFIIKVVREDGSEKALNAFEHDGMIALGFRECGMPGAFSSPLRAMVTNVYRTKDDRFYHTHSSMNPAPTITALGLPLEEQKGDTFDSAISRLQDAVAKFDSYELDNVINEDYKQAGTVCWSADEYQASEHGKANAHANLYTMDKAAKYTQPPSWWPEHQSVASSARRPLAGLKVVDLTRVIAGPSITRSLAEMGASVMRVTSNKVVDFSGLHCDLNWGKWNCNLHLKGNAGDKEKLAALIRDADVVVEGYRPGAMARNGFGRDDIFELVKNRDRGIIHVRENCYGWNGPWAHRSGWQQISDACCGVALSYGQAMGHNEPVTPVFPNSDFCTGIAGSIGILHALIRRAEEGGSWSVDASLNYYSQWLVDSVGTYPDAVWRDVWDRHGRPVFRNYHSMIHTIPALLKSMHEHDEEAVFNPEFFERRTSKAVGHTLVQIKPIARFKNDEVQLKFNVGTRSNGVDQARWPEDLTTEMVV